MSFKTFKYKNKYKNKEIKTMITKDHLMACRRFNFSPFLIFLLLVHISYIM